MKNQIDLKNNNTQVSDDDTTTQIQIGPGALWKALGVVFIILLIIRLGID